MTKCFFKLVILFYLFIQINTFAQPGWEWQYPKPQGNTLSDIFILNENVAFAVGAMGTIMKTTDGGLNWNVKHHAGGTNLSLCSVYFTDELNGWAVGGKLYQGTVPAPGVVLKTGDGGINWEQVTMDINLPFTKVYFVDDDTGFVFSERGYYYRTTDAGVNWHQDVINERVYYLPDAFDPRSVTFTDKNTGWLVGTGFLPDFFKTTDCGRSWVWQNPSPVLNGNDIFFLSARIGFVVSIGGEFIKTTDHGNSWQKKILTQNGTNKPIESVYFLDSLKGWITGEHFLWTTTDGGENWTDETINENDYLLKIKFFNEKPDGWMVGLWGAIYKTTNEGADWISQRDDIYSFYDAHFLDDDFGWVVGPEGALFNTSNGGKQWINKSLNNEVDLLAVQAFDVNNLLIFGSKKGIYTDTGIIMKSTDGGNSWNQSLYGNIKFFTSCAFINDNTGFLSGSTGLQNGHFLFKTINRGDSWSLIQLDTIIETSSNKIQFVNSNTGWFCGILKTTDSGSTWHHQTIPLHSYDYFFIDPNVGWAVGDNNISKSNDGGITWHPCSNYTSGISYGSVFFNDENTGWVTGYISGKSLILKTTNGGISWIEQDCPIEQGAGTIYMRGNTGWILGAGIIYTKTGGDPQSIKDEFVLTEPAMFTLYQNYPNPFNPTTEISFELLHPGTVNLKISDILGREVKTLINDYYDKGFHKIRWDASNLSSGVYLCVIQINMLNKNYYTTKKMMLIK